MKYLRLRHERDERESVVFRVASKLGGRSAASASRQSKLGFIAIEKRITTWHREAPVLTMPVTCHHCFELCRHALSSKLAGTHPSLRLPACPACRSAMANEHHCMLDFGSNRLYSPTCNGPFQPQEWITYAGCLFCHHAGLFACCVSWSISFASIIWNVYLLLIGRLTMKREHECMNRKKIFNQFFNRF